MLDLLKKQPQVRILLDCTHTYTTGLNTGIQRVVRNLCKMAVKLGPEHQFHCQPVTRVGTAYFPVSFEPKQEKWSTKIARWTRAAYRGTMSVFCAAVPIPILRRWFLPEPGHYGIFKIPCRIGRALQYRAKPFLTRFISEDDGSIQLKSGDVLMLLEPNTFKEGWQTLDDIAARGVTVGSIVYDLIPLTHAQYVHGGNVIAFGHWFDGIANRADFFVAISETVREELQEYLIEQNYNRQRNDDHFDSFRLGCDLDQVSKQEVVRDEVRKLFTKSDKAPIYLLVATVEPRKNHMFLLDAFDKAWREGSPAKLCLIGRFGWLCDDIVARIEQHPALGKQLFWFRDLNDNELAHSYQHADGLMYPSIKEGFGLPLIEALSHHLLVLASDIPIHREVGQDFCAYFSLDNAQQLAEMILSLDRDPHCIKVRDPREYDIADWKQSCREFLAACQAQVQRLRREAQHEQETPELEVSLARRAA